jgi:signal transduction histidine kinase
MTIKTQFRINILVSVGLALIGGGILFYTNHRIDVEMGKNWMADRITKSVFDLHNLTNSYLLYREERQKVQWNLSLASLKKTIEEAKHGKKNVDENLEIISERCNEMGGLFERIISYADRLDKASGDEAVVLREAYHRLITNLTAKGQEMVNRAFLLIQESNRDLSSVKKGSITLVMTSILVAIGASVLISLFLNRRILTELHLLQKGTEVVAGGTLDYRVDIRSEDEIGLLAAAFNEMTGRLGELEKEREDYVKKLAQSNRDLEDFAFVASHDLQEPLRKIQTFGDRLKEKRGDTLGEDGLDYLGRMRNAADRMQTLIQALLTYSRVTSRPEPFSKVSLTSLVQEVVSDMAPHIEQTGARLEIGDLPVIESSPHQMRQLFQNLMSNSLKYRSGEPPLIRISGKRVNHPPVKDEGKRKPWVEIRVADNGIGFDEKYLDRVFQPFQRLHGRSQYEGTGMGLAICRKIVERHGGTITAKSAPGRGATFIITLPVEQTTSEKGARGDGESESSHP